MLILQSGRPPCSVASGAWNSGLRGTFLCGRRAACQMWRNGPTTVYGDGGRNVQAPWILGAANRT
jgi:hypothetical protein